MNDKNYDEYIVPAPIIQKQFAKGLIFNAPEHFNAPNFWLQWDYVKKAHTMEKEPHCHDYDEIFNIFGADSNDITDFDAEIEFYFGREPKKYVITKPSSVFVPKGIYHCPMVFKRVGKPLIFLNAGFSNEYTKIMLNGEKVGLPKPPDKK